MSGVFADGVYAQGMFAQGETTLEVGNASHAHAADAPTLSIGITLTVASAAHAHTAQSPTLNTGITLAVSDVAQAHASQSPGLTLDTTLSVGNAAHAQAAEGVVLNQAPSLVVQGAQHDHGAESSGLTIGAWLAVADAWHVHGVQSPTLQQIGVEYEVEDAFIARPRPRNWRASKMTPKIGPIQTGEAKIAAFDFSEEGVSGVLSEPMVTVAVVRGNDESPDDLLEGAPSVVGEMVHQKVAYRVPNVRYLLQATAEDSAGMSHTVSAYLWSRPAA
jgi:hypothetical protein